MLGLRLIALAGLGAAVEHTLTGSNLCGCSVADPAGMVKCIIDKEKAGGCKDPELADVVTYEDSGLCVEEDAKALVFSLGDVSITQMELAQLVFESDADCDPGTAVALNFGTGECGSFKSNEAVGDFEYELTTRKYNETSISTFDISYIHEGSALIDESSSAVRIRFGSGCTVSANNESSSLTFKFVDPGSVDGVTSAVALGSALVIASALM